MVFLSILAHLAYLVPRIMQGSTNGTWPALSSTSWAAKAVANTPAAAVVAAPPPPPSAAGGSNQEWPELSGAASAPAIDTPEREEVPLWPPLGPGGSALQRTGSTMAAQLARTASAATPSKLSRAPSVNGLPSAPSKKKQTPLALPGKRASAVRTGSPPNEARPAVTSGLPVVASDLSGPSAKPQDVDTSLPAGTTQTSVSTAPSQDGLSARQGSSEGDAFRAAPPDKSSLLTSQPTPTPSSALSIDQDQCASAAIVPSVADEESADVAYMEAAFMPDGLPAALDADASAASHKGDALHADVATEPVPPSEEGSVLRSDDPVVELPRHGSVIKLGAVKAGLPPGCANPLPIANGLSRPKKVG